MFQSVRSMSKAAWTLRLPSSWGATVAGKLTGHVKGDLTPPQLLLDNCELAPLEGDAAVVPVVHVASGPLQDRSGRVDPIGAILQKRHRGGHPFQWVAGRGPAGQAADQYPDIPVTGGKKFFAGRRGCHGRAGSVIYHQRRATVRRMLTHPVQEYHLVDTGVAGSEDMLAGIHLWREDIDEEQWLTGSEPLFQLLTGNGCCHDRTPFSAFIIKS